MIVWVLRCAYFKRGRWCTCTQKCYHDKKLCCFYCKKRSSCVEDSRAYVCSKLIDAAYGPKTTKLERFMILGSNAVRVSSAPRGLRKTDWPRLSSEEGTISLKDLEEEDH